MAAASAQIHPAAANLSFLIRRWAIEMERPDVLVMGADPALAPGGVESHCRVIYIYDMNMTERMRTHTHAVASQIFRPPRLLRPVPIRTFSLNVHPADSHFCVHRVDARRMGSSNPRPPDQCRTYDNCQLLQGDHCRGGTLSI